MRPYENLEAWRSSHELVLLIYETTATFRAAERYGLVSQARRAAVSIPANIAEGHAKRASKEFSRFMDIARGSLSELSYLIRVSTDLGMIPEERSKKLDDKVSEVGRLTWGLHDWARKNPR